MARLLWMILTAAAAGALLLGASWAAAYANVANLLGSPPPEMGNQTTTFLWEGAPHLRGHPRAWHFVYGPTRIPGAPTVQIYVSPFGHVIATDPSDLEARVKVFHAKGF